MRLYQTLLAIIAVMHTSHANAQNPTQAYPNTGGGILQGQSGQYGLPQFGQGANSNNFMPNIYNPQTQPLSPYLNLLRGGNVATNYFYGVRPGTVGLGGGQSGGAPFMAYGGNRTLFFPTLAFSPDPFAISGTGTGTVLPAAGHPVVFNNTLGFFPTPFGQAGGARPGLAGIGTATASGRK